MAFDQYRPSGFKLLPPVVKNILIISGLFYLAKLGLGSAFNINLDEILGMHFFTADKFQPYQIVTYLFMHANFSHVFFNMFAFWMFGYVLENVWGAKRFLIFFFVTGLGAAMIQMVVFYFQMAPMLEAIEVYKNAPSFDAFNNFMDPANFQVVSNDVVNHGNTFLSKYHALGAQADTLRQIANVQFAQAGELQHQALQMPQLADSLNAQSALLTSQAEALRLQSDSLNTVNLRSTVDFVDQYRADYLNAPLVIGASGAVFGVLLAFGMLFPNTRIYLYFLFPIKAKWLVIGYGAIELALGFGNIAGDNVAHFAHLGGMLFGFILIKIWNKKNRKTLY